MLHFDLSSALQSLVGQPVSFKRIAGNSMILYFGGGPGDDGVRSLWFDPPWRYERTGTIVVGSYDIVSDGPTEEFDRTCGLIDALTGSVVRSIDCVPLDSDLCVHFADEQVVRSFAADTSDDYTWCYRDRAREVAAYVSARGTSLAALRPQKSREQPPTV